MATFKKKKKERTTGVGEDVENLGPFVLLVGMHNSAAAAENGAAVFQKSQKLITVWLSVKQNYYSLLTEYSCTPNVWVFQHQAILQFSAATKCLTTGTLTRVSEASAEKGLVPQHCPPPFQMPVASPGCHLCFWL